MAIPMGVPKEVQEKAKGRQQFIYNKQLVYEWDQTIDEVNIYIQPPKFVLPKYKDETLKQLPPGSTLPKLDIKIDSKHLKVGINIIEKPFLDEDLWGQVKHTDSFWMIEDDELHISLTKLKKAGIWDAAIKGHESMDPLTQEEVKKNILLERFQEENPGFDFSGAQVNGMTPDPREFMGGVKYQ